MQRTHIYLPEEYKREIESIARVEGRTKAEITRDIFRLGLKALKPKKSHSAKALIAFAKEAKKFTGSAPHDLALQHDFYTWGGKKVADQGE